MMPKAKGDPYFISCRKGAEEAAKELGVELLWDGPTDLDPAKQNEVVEAWITRGVDVIAVSVENKVGISTVLRKAREHGHQGDHLGRRRGEGRARLLHQPGHAAGHRLHARRTRPRGSWAARASSRSSRRRLSAANQNEWIKYIKARLAEKYPGLKLVAIQPSDGDRDRAFAETQTVLKVYPNVKLIMAIAAPAVPGAAEAVQAIGTHGREGHGPLAAEHVQAVCQDGVIESIVLWNTLDLGYLTVYAARALAAGELKAGATKLAAGRLGEIEVEGDQVMLGAALRLQRPEHRPVRVLTPIIRSLCAANPSE